MFVEARNWAIKIFPFPQNKKVVSRLGEFLIWRLGSLELKQMWGLWHHFNTWITFYMLVFPFELKSTTNYGQEWLANWWVCWTKTLLHPPRFFDHRIWVVPQLSHRPLSLPLFQSQMHWSHFMTTESVWFKKLIFSLLMPLAFFCFYWENVAVQTNVSRKRKLQSHRNHWEQARESTQGSDLNLM